MFEYRCVGVCHFTNADDSFNKSQTSETTVFMQRYDTYWIFSTVLIDIY